jgi:hypothetical protein
MTALWIAVALAIAAALVACAAFWRSGDLTSDLGAVSHQWLAEHRLGSGHDSRR